MKEVLIMKLFRCDNGITISVKDPGQQSPAKLNPIWYEGNPQLNNEIVIKEVPLTQNATEPYDIFITGWSTRMTSGQFYFYLLQRIVNESDEIIQENVVCKFFTHCVNTNKVDACDVFQNVFSLFTFEYNYKFWDRNTYSYLLNVMNVREDLNILINYPSDDILNTANRIFFKEIPGVIRLPNSDAFPAHRINLDDRLITGKNKVLFTCNQYGESSGGSTTNVGVGKTWFTFFRYEDSMISNIEYLALTTGFYLVFETYANKS